MKKLRLIAGFAAAALLAGCAGGTVKSASGLPADSLPPALAADSSLSADVSDSADPETDEQYAEYQKQYLEPANGCGLLWVNFSRQNKTGFYCETNSEAESEKLSSTLMGLFHVLEGNEQMETYFKQYFDQSAPQADPEKDGFPAEVADEVLTAHLDLSEEELHRLLSFAPANYLADRNVYLYQGGVGGMSPVCTVTAAEKSEDVLTLHYSLYEDVNTLPESAVPAQLGEGVLTLREEPDGGFVYLTNSVTQM